MFKLSVATVALLASPSSFSQLHYYGPQASVSNEYVSNADKAITSLLRWYNTSSGLWDTTGWWNSANALTVIADFAAINPSFAPSAEQIFENTFTQAQKTSLKYVKTMNSSSLDTFIPADLPVGLELPRLETFPGFINEYYDDEGWWTLAWIRIYDLTNQDHYLQIAMDLFADMTGGWTAPCDGGLWWNKDHSYNGAIENELFLAVAASLATRAPLARRHFYLQWALKQWHWFKKTGMINENNNINNGMNTTSCKNDGGIVWTYNQGVILGGLLELHKAWPDPLCMEQAEAIATAAIESLQGFDGILHEFCEPDCGADGPQFKGIFMRNLVNLQRALPRLLFSNFILRNADSIWEHNRDDQYHLGLVWSGPFQAATASEQSSACDALVAAAILETDSQREDSFGVKVQRSFGKVTHDVRSFLNL